MKQKASFWDRIADRYAKRPISDEASYRRKLEITQSYFRPDMQVLEFGCGTGGTALIHAAHVKHIRAIDISSRMIEIARARADAQKVQNVTFERSALEELEVDDQSFDAVLGMSILHLLDDWQGAIARVYQMLAPGGLFVSSTTCMGDMNALVRVIVPIGRFFGRFPFVQFFSRDELTQAIVEAGFSIEEEWQPGRGKAVFVIAKKPSLG